MTFDEQCEEMMDELVEDSLPSFHSALALLAVLGVVRVEMHPSVWPAMHRRFKAMHDAQGPCDDADCAAEDPSAAIPLAMEAPNGGTLELKLAGFEPCAAGPTCPNCVLMPFPPPPPSETAN